MIPVTVEIESSEIYITTAEMEDAIKKAEEIAGISSAFCERYVRKAHIQAYVPTQMK